MPSRDNYQICGSRGLDLFKSVFKAGVNFRRHRETLAVGKRFAVVDDADGKPHRMRRIRKRDRDVAAPKNIQDRLRQDWLDEYFERPAADLSIVVVSLVI